MNSKFFYKLSFHAFVTLMYFCALVRYEYLPPLPHKKPHEHYAGRWKYLTYWNLIVHFLFFALSCIMDLMKSQSGGYPKLTRFRDKLYAGIVLPYGLFVVAVFWILYSIDRELIFPRILDPVFPAWLNHVSHTVIFPVLLLEMYMIKHRHPRRKNGLLYTAGFGLIYITWVLYLALAKDIWPYPILQILDWGQRFVFFAVGIIFVFLMYFIGEKLNSVCWGDNVVQKNK